MKVITVPKTTEAASLLDLDQCPDELLDEIYLTTSQFYGLWKSGVFALLNLNCGTLIDDYEDSEIEGSENIAIAIECVESIAFCDDLVEIASEIASLLKRSLLYGTNVYFFF